MVELTNQPEDLKRFASRDNLKDIIDLNDDFKAVLLNYKSMYFNLPIFLRNVCFRLFKINHV